MATAATAKDNLDQIKGNQKKRQQKLTLLRNNLETINAPLARRGIYLESLQLRLSRLPRLKYIGKRILILEALK